MLGFVVLGGKDMYKTVYNNKMLWNRVIFILQVLTNQRLEANLGKDRVRRLKSRAFAILVMDKRPMSIMGYLDTSYRMKK